MKTDVIIPSAGSGTRMNKSLNKLFLPLGDGCVLEKTFRAFLSHPDIQNLIVPCREEDQTFIHSIIEKLGANDRIICVLGGKTRTESVLNALREVKTQNLLIHDGARPFIDSDTITRVIQKTIECGACIPVLPPHDTVKEVKDNVVLSTLTRENLALVQTPQGFNTQKLIFAYQNRREGVVYTDDASVYEEIGQVHVVLGNADNIKLTTPNDVKKEYLSGVGFDAHRFEKGRDLILGGIKIPHDKGLLGHSDADVVLHALMDALLSSVHERDIGYHFPCTEEFKDISSVELLKRVLKILQTHDAEIVNASIVIVAEKPKLSPHINEIGENIAKLLGISSQKVSLTATTTEKLGFTGREEGIACEAIVSVRA